MKNITMWSCLAAAEAIALWLDHKFSTEIVNDGLAAFSFLLLQIPVVALYLWWKQILFLLLERVVLLLSFFLLQFLTAVVWTIQARTFLPLENALSTILAFLWFVSLLYVIFLINDLEAKERKLSKKHDSDI